MKVFGKIMKVLAALAAVVGAIYLLATYGDKICAWAKKLLNRFNCLCCCGDDVVIVEQVAAEEEAVQAEEQDFESEV